MAFIGNTNTTQAFTPAIDYFSGNASTTAFTLSKPVASVAQVQVVVNNVAQNPSSAYTVSGNTITFTSAPSSGTNNIYVYYTSPITQVIAPGQNTVYPSSLSTTNALYWDTSGNVGIGTTTLTNKLNVAGGIQSSSALAAAAANMIAVSQESGFGRIAAFGPNSSTAGTLQLYVIDSIGGNQTGATITSAGLFQFNSGYGSVATAYGCRAWVNFNGTGTVAIRASGNVTSITDNGTGDFTVNFTNAMPDTNFTGVVSNSGVVNGQHLPAFLGSPGSNDTSSNPSTSAFRCSFYNVTNSGLRGDPVTVSVAVFR